MNTNVSSKTLGNTFLFNSYDEYNKNLFNFIMNGEEIDKNDEAFEDIKYEIKKYQISSSLVKVLMSNNIILMIGATPLAKAFKVFTAKDIRGDNKLKVFIDCTNLIKEKDGKYVCDNHNVLVSYLISAMNSLIYYADNKRILMNSNLTDKGTRCFAAMFTHILDYVYKVSSMSNIRDKALYLASIYYQANILGKDYDNESVTGLAKKISGLSEREQDIIKVQYSDTTFTNIKGFVESCSKILKLDKLTLDLFLEKWMYIYGTGTLFGLELYPQFASIMTDAYVGAYLNNQKSIEKIAGRNMVEFTKEILKIGADAV